MVETSLTNYDEAGSYYQSFLEEYPDSFEANALYTQLLALSDETDQAREWLEKTRELAMDEEQQTIIEQLEGIVNPS